ncbi:acyltransferase family protein [Chitinophaga japonensis]|uniref:Peptidoglycan/LPS O-acetylase OafA/YrhL n=1 Tax=Chitinophaga japonensis TaxID=104662 RepID=A0A562T4D9_CHIJA|nr:acyltransferase [Chitinophaga japonensis]TWI87926.1 peptidoglycan/LPS O-acetylase OafA/YrhL [Chitinophaga japonensis]
MRLSWGMQAETADKRLAGLDHLRALAITLVFICHYRMFGHPAWLNDIGSFGWTGVDLFFVLSGYLIAGQLFGSIQKGRPISLKEFYLKRFFRILPAYLAVLVLYFTIPAFKEREGLSALWRYLTFTQNFGLNLGETHAFTHAWSLCIEEQFYLLLPLVILCFLRLNIPKAGFYLLLALFIGGLAVRTWSWFHFVAPLDGQDNMGITWFQWIYYPTYCRLDGLLTGICIAGIFRFRPAVKERLLRHGNGIFLLGLGMIVGAYFFCSPMVTAHNSIAGFPLLSVAFGLLVIGALSPRCILYRFRSRVTATLAALSYSIYLSHKAVANLTQEVLARWMPGLDPNGVWMFLVCISTVVLAGAILRYVVEKPFLRLRDRVLRRQPKPAAAPVPELTYS